jgi:hypothetical protein
MPISVSHWIGPFVPVLLMLSIVITNHVVAGQRNEKRTTAESFRFSIALLAELRAILELYKMNLDLIERKAGYILSTRSSIVVYKGNLGRLTMLLDESTIEHVVAVFAQNERIEAIIAAHANLKCNLTYQITSADALFDEWGQMYQMASRSIASTCCLLEGRSTFPETVVNENSWRPALDRFINGARQVGARRLSVG